MSKLSTEVKQNREKEVKKAEINFMGGISYALSPIETMKMVTASSIFGEPQYYREGSFKDGTYHTDKLFKDYSIMEDKFEGMKTGEIMEKVINDALDYDFETTLEWAVTLRNEFNMRLNPQVIMVMAAMHPKRIEFNEIHPGRFSEINKIVMSRADEPASQLAYYLYKNGSKNNLPGILKRNWADKLEGLSRYQVAKYKNAEVGMIDTIRICHANNEILDELMKTGTVQVEENERTWENMRSAGASWTEILAKCKLGHMALLRNLRNIFAEIDNIDYCKSILNNLKNGVLSGKQFPFRYYTAYQMINGSDINHKPLVLDALEECIDIACDNMPKLKGKTVCLSDNSGSAWGTVNSEYGTATVAIIDNLSSVITARNSEEGYVGAFGDKLKMTAISKRNGVLAQTNKISECRSSIGQGTENGIWLFLDKAITNKEHWDNIFIYSDMQAGHGGLYGTRSEMDRYVKLGYGANGRYIDVAKLINTYRSQVNPNVNVFMVQTAGYTNALVPEYGYRTNIMYGWTGKELVFADEMINFWDKKNCQ